MRQALVCYNPPSGRGRTLGACAWIAVWLVLLGTG